MVSRLVLESSVMEMGEEEGCQESIPIEDSKGSGELRLSLDGGDWPGKRIPQVEGTARTKVRM